MSSKRKETVLFLIDVDGVLGDVHSPFVKDYEKFRQEYAKKKLSPLSVGHISTYGFGAMLSDFKTLTEYGVEEFMFGISEEETEFEGFLPMTDQYWLKTEKNKDLVPPIEPNLGAKLSAMQKQMPLDKVEYHIVTSRPGIKCNDEVLTRMKEWLKYHEVHKGTHYSTFESSDNKHNLPYDFYLEDNTLIEPKLAEDNGVLIGYLQPWNRDVFLASEHCYPTVRLEEVPAIVDQTLEDGVL